MSQNVTVEVVNSENVVVVEAYGPQGIQGPAGPAGAQGPIGTGGVLGLYGSFYDVTTQALASATVAQAVALGTTAEANGVSIASSSRVTFSTAGTYSVTWSAQFTNSGNQIYTADMWLRKNGSDIADSSSRFDIPATKSGIDGHLIGTINYVLTVADGDYVQVYWSGESTTLSLEALPAASSPTRPRIPAIILTATQVMYTQEGPQGDTGPTGPQGDPGDAATIAVGTVTTGSAGSSASVTNAGTSSAAVFNFTIPRGDTGATGAAGAKGDKGDKGDTGDTGPAGPNSVTVNTTTISGGTSGRVLYDNAGTIGEVATTGSGSVVLASSPTLTTPSLGTPSALTLTNATGLPLSSGVTGTLPVANGGTGTTTPALVAGTNVTITGTWPNQTINAAAGSSGVTVNTTTITGGTSGRILYDNAGTVGEKAVTGSGDVVLATSPTLVTPALGTPSSGTLTNATGLPVSTGISGLGTGVATFLATPSSSNLAAAVTDETGSGSLVFATSPTLTTPDLGTPSALTLTNATGLPVGGISATGTPSSTTYLRGDGSWQTVSGGGSPGGSTTQLQYNNAGAFDGANLWQSTNTVEQRNGTNAQTLSVYATYTDASNYERTTISSATYSSALYHRIRAETAGTGGDNINLVLSPAGTGAITARMPDGTATGGNARGTNAVDLQTFSAVNTRVASGINSCIPGGKNNTASGESSFAAGESAVASGLKAVAFSSATASGPNSFAVAGTASADGAKSFAVNAVASGVNSVALCARSSATLYGQVAESSYGFAGAGDAQASRIVFYGETTDATQTQIYLRGQSTSPASIPNNTTWLATLYFVARSTSGTDNAGFVRRIMIKKGTTNASAAVIGSIQTIDTDIGSNSGSPPSGWDVTADADTTNGALAIKVTGAASTTIRWVCQAQLVEVGLA